VSLVIDASVAVKWVLPEDGADRAAALRKQDQQMIAPTLIAAEIGSAMRKHVAAKNISEAEAMSALKLATRIVDRLVPLPELSERALQLSIVLQHPIYDCFYLALAEREDAALVTADVTLLAKAKKAKMKTLSL
jgi:predicted nucleic acid-binding protein